MKAVFSKNLFFFLAVFFILLAFFSWKGLTLQKSDQNEQAYINSVSRNLNKELDKVRKQSSALKKVIQRCDRPTFSRLLKSSAYPYFIYRNHYLYFWSDNSFIPKHELAGGPESVRFVTMRSGSYVVHRDLILKRGDIFEIYFFIPLSKEYSIENEYLQSHLNENIFSDKKVNLVGFPSGGASIYTSSGDYLFSMIFPPEGSYAGSPLLPVIFISATLGLIFLVIYVIRISRRLVKYRGAGTGLLFLFVSLGVTRLVMLVTGFPYLIHETDLFDSKYFASSAITPSLGDLVLNLLFLLIWAIFFSRYYYRTGFVRKIIKNRDRKLIGISFLLLILSFLVFYYVFHLLLVLFTHSQWEMDVTENIQFTLFRIFSLMVFGLLFSLFVIFSYIFSKLFLFIHKRHDNASWGILLLAVLTFSAFVYFVNALYLPILILVFLFFTVVLYFKFPKISFQPRYGSYFYLLFAGLACALSAAFASYQNHKETEALNKQKFASQLLVENDVLGEYLLSEALGLLNNDPFIQSRILNPFGSKELVEHKIKRVYLGDYFNKYDIKVHVFDAMGIAYSNDREFNYWPEVVAKYKIEQFKTEYPGIYLMYDAGKTGFKKYLVFSQLRKRGSIIGYILIELKQKRIIPHSVYPELLVDRRILQPWESENYSYAIFGKDEIRYTYGQFNYESDFKTRYLNNEKIYENGIVRKGFHHVALKSKDDRVVIVSSEESPFYRFFSNFSFFYIVLLVFILIFVIAWSYNLRFRKIDANFSTKIQIYLNLAFFVPLSIVTIATLSIISSSYRENLNESFVKKAEAVSNSINMSLESESIRPSKRQLERLLVEKSRFLDADINLYDNKGRLLFSNQPLIYEAGLLSGLINPEAYSTIRDHKKNIFMLSEQVGTFKYNSVYIAVKSFDSGYLLGILSIPFFSSKQEVEQQLAGVLTTILNIFISIFIIFLLISYLVSKLLTVPLDLITEKLRKTSLAEKNEPLEWESKDEIGLLVDEYNKMLVKLEESKDALSKSEKESAWREMAQQVAHEIKNPLTPMKLSIQHLQRAVKNQGENLQDMASRTLQLLLDQVNTLNEIATSFSVFAKMPIPKNEQFDFVKIISQISRLHKADSNISIQLELPASEVIVNGDRQLIGNILSNLVLNAVQAVPNTRKPDLKLKLSEKDDRAVFSLEDNGDGIPEDVQDKVFIPNFSTKYSGSGLGLAIAKRGVEHAGGRIWFETIQGQGTTFFIELPLIDNAH